MIGTVAGFRAHALARGNSAPTDAGDPAATAALVRAGDYLRAHYRAAADAEAPDLEDCAYLVAAVEIANPGGMSRSYSPGERKVLEAVGNIRWKVLEERNAAGGMTDTRAFPVLTLVDGLLGGYRLPGPLLA